MGLDQYLGRYRKANITKRGYTYDEYQALRNNSKYSIFTKIPSCLEDIATEIIVTEKYYDMDKISKDYANGNEVHPCSWCGNKVGFSNYKLNISFELPSDNIEKNYTKDVLESVYVVEGSYEVAYWRKANQIREWFINHLDNFPYDANGEYFEVTKEILEELIDDCHAVICNHDLAEEILPTSSGFFFGSTEYDEWYFDQLERTIEQLQVVIKETDWDNEIVTYSESW